MQIARLQSNMQLSCVRKCLKMITSVRICKCHHVFMFGLFCYFVGQFCFLVSGHFRVFSLSSRLLSFRSTSFCSPSFILVISSNIVYVSMYMKWCVYHVQSRIMLTVCKWRVCAHILYISPFLIQFTK